MKHYLKDTNPELAKEWAHDLNTAINLDTVTRSMKRKVWWVCSKDPRHTWEAAINSRVYNKSGCLYCAGKLVLKEESLGAKHPELLEEWDWEKNKNVDPYSASCGSNKRVGWVCKNDPTHKWDTAIYSRAINKTGCRKCGDGNRPRRKPKQYLVDSHPSIAKEWDFERNTGIDVNTVTHGSARRVWWKCKADPPHSWETTVVNRTSNLTGCPECSGSVPSKANSLATIYPDVAEEWDHEKNDPLTPDSVTRASGKKVWWRCKVDPSHSWPAVIRNRTILKSGCPICEEEIKGLRVKGYMLHSDYSPSSQYKICAKNLYTIEALLSEGSFSKDHYLVTFKRLLYSSAITALETYLSDLFRSLVLADVKRINKLLINSTEHKSKKYSIQQAVNFEETKRKEAEKYINETVWHNLPKVAYLYRKVLNLEFDKCKMPALNKHVSVRHDIVHRNGRNKNGEPVSIKDEDVLNCVGDVKEFVESLELKQNEI